MTSVVLFGHGQVIAVSSVPMYLTIESAAWYPIFVCALCCRQRRKERKQQRRLQRQNHHHQNKEKGGDEAQNGRKRPRREVTSGSLRLVVDCSFDNLMLIKVNGSGNSGGTPFICKLQTVPRVMINYFVLSSGCPEAS